MTKIYINIRLHALIVCVDPELQPVRSYESDVGVIQLYKLSCAINKKVSPSLMT